MVMRKKWLALAIFVVSISAAAVLCIVLPKTYRSSTLILVEDQKIPENYVKGIVGSNVEERLTMIQQQVMSRTLLSQAIKDFKCLYGPSSVTSLGTKHLDLDGFTNQFNYAFDSICSNFFWVQFKIINGLTK